MPKPQNDVPAVAGRRDVVGCRMPGSSAGEGHAPRSHIAHKRNNEESYVTTKGRRKIHISPPLTQATRGQHQAQRQQLCWLQDREGTQRTEKHREQGMLKTIPGVATAALHPPAQNTPNRRRAGHTKRTLPGTQQVPPPPPHTPAPNGC